MSFPVAAGFPAAAAGLAAGFGECDDAAGLGVAAAGLVVGLDVDDEVVGLDVDDDAEGLVVVAAGLAAGLGAAFAAAKGDCFFFGVGSLDGVLSFVLLAVVALADEVFGATTALSTFLGCFTTACFGVFGTAGCAFLALSAAFLTAATSASLAAFCALFCFFFSVFCFVSSSSSIFCCSSIFSFFFFSISNSMCAGYLFKPPIYEISLITSKQKKSLLTSFCA